MIFCILVFVVLVIGVRSLVFIFFNLLDNVLLILKFCMEENNKKVLFIVISILFNIIFIR